MGECIITRRGGEFSGEVELLSIRIETPPARLDYIPGETFDPTGMVVIGEYRFGLEEDVTTLCTYDAVVTSTAHTISYSENGVTVTTDAELENPASSTLNNNEWDTIQRVIALDIVANYWSVGARKGVTLNGTVGALTFSNQTYYPYIIGIDHNESIEGKGIHFCFGHTALSGGRDVAFCDAAYKTAGSTDGFRMNLSGSNAGGWSGSYMQKTICPAFLSALPYTLQNVIVPCPKYTDNQGASNNVASAVTLSSSEIWIYAEFEVHGSRVQANSTECAYQKQYAYFVNGNSKVKYKSDDTSTVCTYWTRSARANYSHNYIVSSNGSVSGEGCNYSCGFAPCFKVGVAA